MRPQDRINMENKYLILYMCGGFAISAALTTPNGLDCIKFFVLGIAILYYTFKEDKYI